MHYGIYAIIDALSNDIVGGTHGLQLHRHEATAIRMFSDIASAQGTIVNQHPGDHALVRLGTIKEDLAITPENTVVLLGATWAAAQNERSTTDNRQSHEPSNRR